MLLTRKLIFSNRIYCISLSCSSLERIIADHCSTTPSPTASLACITPISVGLRRYPRKPSQKRRFLILLVIPVVLSNSCLSFSRQLPLHLALPSAHYSPIIFPMQLSLTYVLPILVFLVLCMIWAALLLPSACHVT